MLGALTLLLLCTTAQSILTAKNHWNEWQQLYGGGGCPLRDLMKRDKQEWALLNRNPKGAYLLDAMYVACRAACHACALQCVASC